MQPDDLTGIGLAFGSAEDGRAWLGRRSERRADVAVNDAMVRSYCSLVEDANPDYWSGGMSPPGLLMTWMMPLTWRPGGTDDHRGLFAFEVPLPGRHVINVSTDTEMFQPLRVGDHVRTTDELVELSGPKRTRLGEGHFLTTVTDFHASGHLVARNTNVLFRYDTAGGSTPSGADPDLEAELARITPVDRTNHDRATASPCPEPGEELPVISLDVSYRRVVLNAAATWDWFPGHHNPFYARLQGQRTIYLSTLFFHGFLDRLVTDWAGPGAQILRRRMRMQRSVYAGQTATARGRITDVRHTADGRLVDIAASVDGPDGPCVPAEITVRLGGEG